MVFQLQNTDFHSPAKVDNVRHFKFAEYFLVYEILMAVDLKNNTLLNSTCTTRFNNPLHLQISAQILIQTK